MRLIAVSTIVILTLSACASSSLERQAGTDEKRDCMAVANDYMQANMHTIPNEWRDHERYKQYQKCLMERRQNQ